ncbi:MAG: nitroreductase family protein [Bacteroidales bacterium]|nr:nitroreductase family protein [Bacteroidales bacterium]
MNYELKKLSLHYTFYYMKDFLELLKSRHSCRRFTDEAVSKESIEYILEAARLSPSGHRVRPWEFFVVEDKETLSALSVSKASGASPVGRATAAIVVAADTTKTDVWVEDCSIATIIMQLAAEELGLGSCWVQIRLRKDAEGNDASENVKRILNLPENYSVLSIVALGHKAEL